MKSKHIIQKELEVYYSNLYAQEEKDIARAISFLKDRGYEVWDMINGKFE